MDVTKKEGTEHVASASRSSSVVEIHCGYYVDILRKDWVTLEKVTYPVLLRIPKMDFTEVDVSWGYNRLFIESSEYADYLRHTARQVCYGFFIFNKEDETWC